MNKQHRYLFCFEPLDSFSFSGETSARTEGVKDSFLAGDKYASRRQSFLVETDCMPPQTTVMGAVRRMLYDHRDNVSIGKNSFNLACNEKQDMGDIIGISPVFLVGENGDFLVPSPRRIAVGKEKSQYPPATYEAYKAKEGTISGFSRVNGTKLTGFIPENDVFEIYEQPVFHIPQNLPEPDEGDYHITKKCRIKGEYVFGTIVELANPLPNSDKQTKEKESVIEPMLLPLGSRDGRFHVTVHEMKKDLKALIPDVEPGKKLGSRYCLSLLSPAVLPEGWRGTRGLTMAFCTPKPMRCATTVDKDTFRMQLIPQKLMLADKGSVFIFSSSEARNGFHEALKNDHRRICGYNYAICYDM